MKLGSETRATQPVWEATMCNIIELKYVKELDNLKFTMNPRPIFIHTHHRWAGVARVSDPGIIQYQI